jgi:Zn-dependent peptidase ImmA (M78 family)
MQLAELSGLSQSRISGIESGLLDVVEDLDSLSRATGFGREWFTQEPLDELPDGTIRYRKKSRAPKRDDRQAIRRLELASELVAKLSVGVRTLPVMLPFLGDSDIEDAAATTRDALGLPAHGPVRNLVRAVERAGVIVVPLPVDLGTPSPRLQHHHGVSAWPDLEQHPVIGFSTNDSGDRQRHTIGHELGHLAMHKGVQPAGRDFEREASQFAGALLMPADDAVEALHRDLTLRQLARLKQTWGVSIAALVMRAQAVGAISRDRAESLFKQLSSRGWRRDEPITVHREEPALLPRLLEARYGRPPDWLRAASALFVPPLMLRQLATSGERDVANPSSPVLDLERRRRSM